MGLLRKETNFIINGSKKMKLKTMAIRKKDNERKEQIITIFEIIAFTIFGLTSWILIWIVSIVF